MFGKITVAHKLNEIHITNKQIYLALSKKEFKRGLEKYRWIQEHVHLQDIRENEEFQRKFNGFYRIRRNQAWRKTFYKFLEKSKDKRVTFKNMLEAFYKETGRVEASFVSKLVATINPNLPVIDSVVLKNLGLKLPSPNLSTGERILKINKLHKDLKTIYTKYLKTGRGKYLIESFRKKYSNINITDTKILDLILWQIRGRKSNVSS
ncbi:hypothetical protein MYX76_12640 [Desulfobacterota bacterium AH_259_B03_O07]|nr:hypothetical protein [Desulfobacterota bacterium AH_259_B03_O07]